ncbi:uncharacterized protein [Haliotis asinina]|uniref:uncharacterized protein n=1 Tax=Haliotis asinina TaxID=109174 RepID=UPI0035317F46
MSSVTLKSTGYVHAGAGKASVLAESKLDCVAYCHFTGFHIAMTYDHDTLKCKCYSVELTSLDTVAPAAVFYERPDDIKQAILAARLTTEVRGVLSDSHGQTKTSKTISPQRNANVYHKMRERSGQYLEAIAQVAGFVFGKVLAIPPATRSVAKVDGDVYRRVDQFRFIDQAQISPFEGPRKDIDVPSAYDYGGHKVIGAPDFYPSYGNTDNAWCPDYLDAEQFIELGIPDAIYITEIHIYEVFWAGGVESVSVRDSNSNWVSLWSTSTVSAIEESRIFAPHFVPPPFKSDAVRLDLDLATINNWSEFDAVRVIGTRTRWRI